MTKRVLMGLPEYYINSGNTLWIVGLFEFIFPVSGIDVLVSGIGICISGIDFGIVGTSLCSSAAVDRAEWPFPLCRAAKYMYFSANTAYRHLLPYNSTTTASLNLKFCRIMESSYTHMIVKFF
jgi:hypothetical protein